MNSLETMLVGREIGDTILISEIRVSPSISIAGISELLKEKVSPEKGEAKEK